MFAQRQDGDPLVPTVSQNLEFLQSGLDEGLSFSTLKVQVFALSAMMGIKWALNPLITQFLKACLKIGPPKKPAFPTWNLATVLEALSSSPFHPIEAVSLWDLTLKTTFLIAIILDKRVASLTDEGTSSDILHR